MADLEEVSNELGEAFRGKAHNQWLAALVAKIIFAAFSALSIVVQFTGADTFGLSNYIGIGSAIIAVIVAIFIAVTERDSSHELEIARKAVQAANEEREQTRQLLFDYSNLQQYETEQVRARELYQAMNTMRGVVEALVHSDYVPVERGIEAILEAAKRSLTIALGYQTAEHYTLCVYKTTIDKNHQSRLSCIAQTRTIDCVISDARQWPTGVGVAGAALARGSEVVVPDMSALQIGSLYAGTSKPYDAERYRSIAAVPILAEGHNNAWGVVVGTSDRTDHFAVGPDRPGVQTVEAVRALAGMVALAVRADQVRVSCGHVPIAGGVTVKRDVERITQGGVNDGG